MPVIKGHTLAAEDAAFVPGPVGRMSRLRGNSRRVRRGQRRAAVCGGPPGVAPGTQG